jgi:hypothetical protein
MSLSLHREMQSMIGDNSGLGFANTMTAKQYVIAAELILNPAS